MKRSTLENILNPYIQNTANMLSQHFLQQGRDKKQDQEKQRQEQEKLKAQQEQMGILNQLVSGKLQSGSYRGKFAPLDMGLNQQDQTDLIGRADDNTLQRYNILSKLNQPKEQPKKELYQWDNKLYERNDDGSLGNVVSEKSKEKVKDYITDEPFGDKMKKLMGYENPEADENDPRTKIVNGKKYTVLDYAVYDILEKKTNASNPSDSYYDLSDDTKKMLKEYFKKQQEYRAITNAGFGNRTRDGKEDTPKFKDELVKHNKVYLQAVRNVMPESAKSWYRKLYNKGGDEIDPRDYLLNLKNSFAKGTLGANPDEVDNYEVADFNILIEQFKPIYGFDPREQYGQFLEKLQ